MKSTEAEDNNFLIRKKMVDMEAYGLNLIGGWSVKNQKLLGDFMANKILGGFVLTKAPKEEAA